MLPTIKVIQVEHKMLAQVFTELETLIPKLTDLQNVKDLARMVKKLLTTHGTTEDDFVYSVLNFTIEEKAHLAVMTQEHQELNGQLDAALSAKTPAEAQKALIAALVYSRAHFEHEEQSVFPMMETHLRNQEIGQLGALALMR